ncbi:DUF1631 domain-containing protein [Pseudomonas fuscovaginae UPB0736]|uniref:DUF1631 domain-containing protein n=1 Tax=Pseudomonas asplenii TaxID=53407 RepID=UPI000288A137|nr:DUF1631 domain-containing protein [Pseudomonas fuscovaginae]UUQ66729.1 DUF1631 domain-containing protein [Pseudomonas fuscovaginae UPB0736]
MHNDGKVVPLHKATEERATPSPLARLPVVLIQVRDKAALQLRQGLQALFDNADDTLFEMADRALNNVDQNTFFEAMRDLRLKRKHIERGFHERFAEAFAALDQYDVHEVTLAAPMSYDKLALVPNDELEKTVALDAMVAKVLSRDGLALGQLTARLNALITRRLDDQSNPMGPAMLCEYFLEAGRDLGVEIKVKLIILKLFEKYVLSDADHLYAEANQLLIATGVLPELKAAPARRASDRPVASARSSQGEASGASSLDASVQEVFSALQELLLHVRGSVAPKLDAASEVQPISTRDLLRLLSHLQQYVPAQAAADDFDLRNQLEQLLTRVSVKSGKSRVVGGVDEDVINLIAMLFEFILDDRTLPDRLKALIGRLQIPMLKVAVVDKSFFSRGSHPARRLLNEIASASLGWGARDDYQRDVLYLRIEQIVQRLLNDFVDDPAIFTELLTDFLAFTSDERRRSELLEQRTRDAEEGRAKAELARQRVQEVLNERLLGRTLPEVVVRLLQEAWSKVLLLVWLKHSEQSAEWQAGLQTMDELIWSADPQGLADARPRLLELVPGLLKALRDGLASAAFDPFATSEFFSQLESLHVQVFQRLAKQSVEPVASDAQQPAMVEVLEEIVLSAADDSHREERVVALPEDDAGLVWVRQLRIGNWVEIREDEESVLRCKLAAIVEPTGKYIFVNRTGMKVLERTAQGLAVEFRRGAVRLLDDTQLFDRALASVIGNLRRLKSR